MAAEPADEYGARLYEAWREMRAVAEWREPMERPAILFQNWFIATGQLSSAELVSDGVGWFFDNRDPGAPDAPSPVEVISRILRRGMPNEQNMASASLALIRDAVVFQATVEHSRWYWQQVVRPVLHARWQADGSQNTRAEQDRMRALGQGAFDATFIENMARRRSNVDRAIVWFCTQASLEEFDRWWLSLPTVFTRAAMAATGLRRKPKRVSRPRPRSQKKSTTKSTKSR